MKCFSNYFSRKVEIEQDVIETTNGSARVRIGATEILVGVKAELEKPDLSTPDEGKLEFNVDCSPNATPMFEGRRGGEHIEAELGGLFDSFYKKESICDRKKLCVVKGQWCWALYVDILGEFFNENDLSQFSRTDMELY